MNEYVYIYALTEPDGYTVRYIGKTINPKVRFASHLRDYNKDGHKSHWIKSLLDKHLQPKMFIVDKTSLKEWKEIETKWIAFYKNSGANLTNIAPGGEGMPKGGHHSLETRRKIGLANTGKKRTHAAKLHQSLLKKGRKQSPEIQKKINSALAEKRKDVNYLKRIGEGVKKAWQRPDYIEKIIIKRKEAQTPERKASHSLKIKAKWANPFYRVSVTTRFRIQHLPLEL